LVFIGLLALFAILSWGLLTLCGALMGDKP
jgi:hypothetical protein